MSLPAGSQDRLTVANAFAERIRAKLSPGAVLRFSEPMARRTTFRVGGAADVFVEPASVEDLAIVLQECAERSIPHMVIGRGSNLLFRDGGFAGVIIALEHPSFCYIRVDGNDLRCGAGARLKQVAHEAKRNSIGGLEFLEGIPGTIGGSLRMNAGAMGSAIFDRAKSVQYMTPAGRVCEADAASFGARYRRCDFFNENIALGAVLSGQAAPREKIDNLMAEYSRKRWSSQPAAASAGCIFKNPEGIPAGKLIDELGLKGTKVGGASVSMEHGNFLVNNGTAQAGDIIRLIEKVQAEARSKRGIELELEVKIVGND